MINAGVLSGDHILVKQQDTAENGEMVAALIDDSATVKHFITRMVIFVFSRKMIPWTRLLSRRKTFIFLEK